MYYPGKQNEGTMTGHDLINSDGIQGKIHTIRGLQLMIDSDLAELYQVGAKVLNQGVKRNIGRFPLEFIFQLTSEEYNSLRSQFVTLNKQRGEHRKYLPYAFTEQVIADRQAAFLTRDDFRLTPMTEEPEVTSPDPDCSKPRRQSKKMGRRIFTYEPDFVRFL
jgi:hypothetical protein